MADQGISACPAACGAAEQVYERKFSPLAGLQEASTLQYRLAAHREGWLLSLERRTAHATTRQAVRLRVEAALAQQLCTYLYENAVSIELWQDVLADLVPQDRIKPEDGNEV